MPSKTSLKNPVLKELVETVRRIENKDEEEIIYMRPSDKMEIGNVSLDRITYIFYKKQFMYVMCNFKKESDYNILEIICEERFGKPIIKEYHGSFCYGNKAMIRLEYTSKVTGGMLAIMSRVINDKKSMTEEGF